MMAIVRLFRGGEGERRSCWDSSTRGVFVRGVRRRARLFSSEDASFYGLFLCFYCCDRPE